MPFFLITNDDGIQSPGLEALVQSLSKPMIPGAGNTTGLEVEPPALIREQIQMCML